MRRRAYSEQPVSRLSKGFRKLSAAARTDEILSLAPDIEELASFLAPCETVRDMADVMVETSVGVMPVPVGVATGFLIDGEAVAVPMAVEEPSVVAAASYAGSIISLHGGLTTWASDPVMTAQVFLEDTTEGATAIVESRRSELCYLAEASLRSLSARGGGIRDLRAVWLPESRVLKVEVHVDVRDAQGANRLNSLAEELRRPLERMTGGVVVMGILSNAARNRLAGARFSVPVSALRTGERSVTGRETARRIALAAHIAAEDESRAVTHNKGIMNGVTALALATGNDTRAVEAAAHAYAARGDGYAPLSSFRVEDDRLHGELELPLALATVGGAVRFHPVSRLALRILGEPDAPRLGRIAAAVGLAQNFAALQALVSEGIQRGHMRLHAARLAFQAGARGPAIREVARRIADVGTYDLTTARRLVAQLGEPPR
jgi:hydroxymethylglutaryl-CoA reductase